MNFYQLLQFQVLKSRRHRKAWQIEQGQTRHYRCWSKNSINSNWTKIISRTLVGIAEMQKNKIGIKLAEAKLLKVEQETLY